MHSVTLIFALVDLSFAVELMRVDEVRPGMRGVGKSVFVGNKVEEFAVEIIDVIHKVSPRGDLILGRLSGAGLEKSGVVAGMSGSPVYIDGKLIGAVAYAWGFAKEPIAGITPITEMTRIWQEEGAERGVKGPRGQVVFEDGHSPIGTRVLAPLFVPVAISGFNRSLADLVTGPFAELGLVPIPGGSSSSSSTSEDTAALVPGGAVGVGLVTGDVRFSAIGTITHREGDRLLAFGHPLLLAGPVELPMVGGRIHTVVPTLDMSFKIFSPTAELGVITQDRWSGISGRIGPQAPMIPVTVRLKSPTIQGTFHFRVANYEALVPLLTSAALANVVFQTEGAESEMTLASRLRLWTGPVEHPSATIELAHVFAGPDPAQGLFQRTRQELATLFENQFQTPDIARMEFELNFSLGRELRFLISAQADRGEVRPGETVHLLLRLEDWRGRRSDSLITLLIPKTVPAGPLHLVIAQRDSLMALETARAPGLLRPRSFQGLIQLLERTGRENELVITGYCRKPGMTLEEKELPALPPFLKAVLAGSKGNIPLEPTASSPVLEQVVSFTTFISGVAELDLEVKP